MVFKKIDRISQELIENLDGKEDIFYRFHNPNRRLSSRSESWGMIFSSKAEALRDARESGLDEEDAILPGKSCMPTFKEIFDFVDQFDKDYILIAFQGRDTRITGHDGEYVATYQKKVACFSFEDVLDLANKTFNK